MSGKVFPTDRMTSRERLLAAFGGGEVDRLPFWPKVFNRSWPNGQSEPFRSMDEFALHDYVHADGLFDVPKAVRRLAPRVESRTTQAGTGRTTVHSTPDGELVERWSLDLCTQSWHPSEFPVKTRQDLARYKWLYTDTRAQVDEHVLAQAKQRVQRVGQRGLTGHGWGTSPLMHLVEHVIGPVNTTYFLLDHPDQMDGLIALMHAANLQYVRRLAEVTPADRISSVENTTTTLISPQQFGRYCLGHLREYGQAIHSAGRMHELHMCGHINALLEEIDTIPAVSIEAFTSPPLGNCRLVEGRTRAPSKTLVGGTNAIVWTKPAEEIIAYIAAELQACADHRRIVLTTGGAAPQACQADTFRQVARWLATLPARC